MLGLFVDKGCLSQHYFNDIKIQYKHLIVGHSHSNKKCVVPILAEISSHPPITDNQVMLS